MDGFEFNKIAGAVLGTGLGVMALSIASEIIFTAEAPERPVYAIAVAASGDAGEAVSATTDLADAPGADSIAVRLQSADAAAGERSAKLCLACHTVGEGQGKKIGPNLWGVVGGPAAHMEGFGYSAALQEMRANGATWGFAELDDFLAAPKGMIPGTSMSFAGLKKPDVRADVIAYLNTLSGNPLPLPQPVATAPAVESLPEPQAPADAADTPPQHSPEMQAPAETPSGDTPAAQ